jgi:hypothetical protein
VRINVKKTFIGLVIAGVAGGFLLMPAVVFIGNMLAPTEPALPASHVPPIIGDALWAMANGGKATELETINPVTIARFISCNVLSERFEGQDTADEHQRRHDECLTILPAQSAIAFVSNAHLQSQGVWQDPRVPFVGFATMNHVARRWTRAQLLDALAERAEFRFGFRGVEQAARGFFNKPAADVTVAEAALLAALLDDRHLDPWCGPGRSAMSRRRVLEKMRDNGAIDEAAFQSADVAPLGLIDPPPGRPPCE